MIERHSELANMMKDWVLSLPKLLWQLRSNHVETSRVSGSKCMSDDDANVLHDSPF